MLRSYVAIVCGVGTGQASLSVLKPVCTQACLYSSLSVLKPVCTQACLYYGTLVVFLLSVWGVFLAQNFV